MKTFKVYGIQRTGTNFLTSLIRKNIKKSNVAVNGFGWKHGYVLSRDGIVNWKRTKNVDIEIPNNIKPIIIIKNPYSWYNSIKRWRINCSGSFNFSEQYKRYNNLYFSHKNMYYSDLYSEPFFIKYEDLISNEEKEINNISKHFGVETTETFDIPKKVKLSDKFTEEKRKYYLRNDDFGMGKKKVKMINDILDWDMLKSYGYTKL